LECGALSPLLCRFFRVSQFAPNTKAPDKSSHSKDFAFDGLMALAQNVSGTKPQRVSFLAIEHLAGVEKWL
jgi:hypothetical protein